jgi:hypothetical protein
MRHGFLLWFGSTGGTKDSVDDKERTSSYCVRTSSKHDLLESSPNLPKCVVKTELNERVMKLGSLNLAKKISLTWTSILKDCKEKVHE